MRIDYVTPRATTHVEGGIFVARRVHRAPPLAAEACRVTYGENIVIKNQFDAFESLSDEACGGLSSGSVPTSN